MAVRVGRLKPTPYPFCERGLKVSWNSNAPIKFKLGTVAIWNLLTRRIIDGSNNRHGVTLGLLRGIAPALFEDLITSPTPTTMENKN